MRGALLAAASVAALMIPGQVTAQASESASFSISSGSPRIVFVRPPNPGEIVINRGFDHRHRHGHGHSDGEGDGNGNGHRHHIHVGDGDNVDGSVLAGGGWGYSGYNDYGDYDANRSFAQDKWNDWWHDNPNRAFPRWMSRNKDCARRWYSGDTLTC